eukprot:Sdes_comp24226_c0_seq1m22229
MQRASRYQKELKQLICDPPSGISLFSQDESSGNFIAAVSGPHGTPYESGLFKVEVVFPSRYPFEPPKLRFITPIYHPNIDNSGRICHDSLKMPPAGAWSPRLNVCSVLASLRLLLEEPNPG